MDECTTDQNQEMILELIGAKMPTRAPIRFLISSRLEPHIAETMKSVACALVLDQKATPNSDIQRYLEGEFYRIFTERGTLPPHLSLVSSTASF